MAAPRLVVELTIEEEDVTKLMANCAIANRTGKPGRAGAHAFGLSR